MLTKALKYQFYKIKKSLFICYACLLSSLIIAVIFSSTPEYYKNILGGTDITIIFAFSVGVVNTYENLGMFLQNGLSRKTLLYSYTISGMIMSMLMAFVYVVSLPVTEFVFKQESIFMTIYKGRYLGGSSLGNKCIDEFLWMAFVYMVAGMLGYFMGALYHRIAGKKQWVIFASCVLLCAISLSVIDYKWTKGAIFKGIKEFIYYASGYNNGYNPYYFVVTSAIASITLGYLSYILLKKATVKVV